MFLEEFLNLIGYKVTSGEKFWWDCFDKNARFIESDEVGSDNGTIRASAIFDTETKVIYQLESSDDRESIGCRWIHPSYRDAYYNEAIAKGVTPDIFYDDVEFLICETVEEWREKSLKLLEELESENFDNEEDLHMDNLKFSLTDFYTRYYDSNGEDIEVQVKRYVDEMYGVQK